MVRWVPSSLVVTDILFWFPCRGFGYNEHLHLPCGYCFHDFCFMQHMDDRGIPICPLLDFQQEIHPVWLRAKGYSQFTVQDENQIKLMEEWRSAIHLKNLGLARQRQSDMKHLVPPPLVYPTEGPWLQKDIWTRHKDCWGFQAQVRQGLDHDLKDLSFDHLPAESPIPSMLAGHHTAISAVNIICETPEACGSNNLPPIGRFASSRSVLREFNFTPEKVPE